MLKFVVITRWTKINNTGSGYINHFIIQDVIDQLNMGVPVDTVLAAYSIPAENFSREIYETYYAFIHDVPRIPIAFYNVPTNELGESYSLGFYENEFSPDSRDQTPRTQFLALLNVSSDRVSGYYDIETYNNGFEEITEVYNTLKNA